MIAALLGRAGLGLGIAELRKAELGDGLITAIEKAFIDDLKTFNIFKTIDHWKHQISAGQGGVEAFDKYAPFAFVSYAPPADSSREGDGDLNQHLRFGIALGARSKEAGAARVLVHLWRDSLVPSFDRWHPGEGFGCDDFYFDDDQVQIDTDHRYSMNIYFKANYIK